MVKTFIFISIILHIATLSIVYYLYKQTETLRQLNLQDVQSLLENTITTIKIENERLQNNLENSQTIKTSNQSKNVDSQSETMVNNEQNSDQKIKAKLPAYSNDSTLATEQSTQLKTKIEDTYKPSLHGQVLQLYEKGVPKEQIAQTLHCGITEIDLILKFHQNK